MKAKLLILAFIGGLPFILNSQTIEYYGGGILNHYYNFKYKTFHKESSYEKGIGFTAGIRISDIVKDLKYNITLSIDNYRGEVDLGNSAQGGSSQIRAKVNNTKIGLGVFPNDITLFKNTSLSIGFDVYYTFLDNSTGKNYSRSGPDTYINEIDELVSKFNMGLSSVIKHDIDMKNGWYLSPFYKVHFGLFSELENNNWAVKSFRQYFGIGIRQIPRIKS